VIGRFAGAAIVAAAFVLSGCGSSSAPAHSSGTSAAQGTGTYVNPVWDRDFPDPAVLRVGATFYAYATQGGDDNIQTLHSSDLVHWRAGHDALPTVGRWASSGNTWAPEVITLGNRYVMYYVAHSQAADKQCIGRATAAQPAGPFVDRSSAPIVCQAALGGSIDPDPVRAADGQLYLYWKNDGNCCGKPVHLWGQRMSADGSQLVGTATALMTNDKAWQGNLVEAPEMIRHGNGYVLFYSANDYASAQYGIGYAACRGPLGPCTDKSEASLIASNDAAAGPGHCFVVTMSDGASWMFYHAWPPDAIGSQSPGRQLWLEPLAWHGGVPIVHPSDPSAQPAPRVGS
jgi:beta-xylosidase